MAAQVGPFLVQDDIFNSADWSIYEVVSVGGTSHSVEQATSGGNPGAFRSMTHTLPPATQGILSEIDVTHLYVAGSYDPSQQGAIGRIEYEEDGLLLSLPFPEAGTAARLALVQDSRLFLSGRFITYIGNTNWQRAELNNLTANSFIAVDGSGDSPDFSASGRAIQFGYNRRHLRTASLPPFPPNQDLVYGVLVFNARYDLHSTP